MSPLQDGVVYVWNLDHIKKHYDSFMPTDQSVYDPIEVCMYVHNNMYQHRYKDTYTRIIVISSYCSLVLLCSSTMLCMFLSAVQTMQEAIQYVWLHW